MTSGEGLERSAPLLEESSTPDESTVPADGATVAAADAEGSAGTEGLSAPEIDAPAVPTAPTEPAAPTAAPQARAKTKGVADIVFLIDVSGSMAPIIDALRKNIEAFVDSLSSGDANNAAAGARLARQGRRLSRHRGRRSPKGLQWLEDNPFVRDAAALKAQLAALQRRRAAATSRSRCSTRSTRSRRWRRRPRARRPRMPSKWRYRSDAARVVVVFTDASFKETMSIPEAKGGSLQDVANVVMANRIILSLFAPNFEGYDRLSQIDKSEWEVVEYEGLNPQEALQKFTADPANFRTTLKQLAASVSRSAETVAL